MTSSLTAPSVLGGIIRVLLLDPLPENALLAFDNAQYQVESCFNSLTEPELVTKLADYHIVCLSSSPTGAADPAATPTAPYLTDEVLRSAHRLLAIGVFSGGDVSHLADVRAAQSMGVPIFNSPYQHQHAVAELVISFMILLSRQIGDRSREIHAGNWMKTSSNCRELRDKTVGIVGYGHVGSGLGVMAEAMGMHVVFYDTLSLMAIGRAQARTSMAEVLNEADFVVVSVSQSSENDNLLDAAQLGSMKKGSFLINVSHAPAVNQSACVEALKSCHLAGAAFDVHPTDSVLKSVADSRELRVFNSPYSGLRNVILTPSLGLRTMEAQARIILDVSTSIVRYIAEGTTVSAANFPSIAAWPLKPGLRRILNMHRNVCGVLKEIDFILSAYNVGKQVLDTKDGVGYLITDVCTENVTTEIVSQLALLSNTIRTRIL